MLDPARGVKIIMIIIFIFIVSIIICVIILVLVMIFPPYLSRSSNLFSSDSEEESLVVDEVVDGKLDVVEPKFSVVENPTTRKPDTIRVGPSSRKPEHCVVEPSRHPDNRGKQPDNHQDLSTTGKFNNEKLVDGKFDNLDERGADEDEKAQEVSLT